MDIWCQSNLAAVEDGTSPRGGSFENVETENQNYLHNYLQTAVSVSEKVCCFGIWVNQHKTNVDKWTN